MADKKREAAVTNASSLIFLAKINALYLLKDIFSKIYVPKEVISEVMGKMSPEIVRIKQEMPSFLEEVEVKEIHDLPLGSGERAAINCCLGRRIPFFISDDLRARKYARSLGIKIIGVIGIMLVPLKEGALTKKDFLDLFQKLIDNKYYLSPQLYAEVMKELRDIPD